jgi:50S ribosome-binding GTPase
MGPMVLYDLPYEGMHVAKKEMNGRSLYYPPERQRTKAVVSKTFGLDLSIVKMDGAGARLSHHPDSATIKGMESTDAPEFVKSLPHWNRTLRDCVIPPIVSTEYDRDTSVGLIENLRRRMREGASAPLRLAFFGPTGVGKSKLFNSLLEEDISPSGFRRPFTRRSLYYLHDHWRALAAGLESEVQIHHLDRWRDLILIDTPDFDSVESSNRREAQRIFAEADAFVFVTDALKYADASTWDYLRRIHQVGKKVLYVLNKVNSREIEGSFRERFLATFQRSGGTVEIPPNDLMVIPEFPIDDVTRIPRDEPALFRLSERLQAFQTDDSENTREQLLRGECQALHDLSDHAIGIMNAREVEVAELRGILQRRRIEAEQRLDQRLATGVTPALRDEVYQRIMQRMTEIDPLRYPRQLLSAPIRGLRHLLQGWWSRGSDEDSQLPTQASTANDVTSMETFQMLESEILRYSDEVRLDFHAIPGFDRHLTREIFLDLRLDHEEIRQLFQKHTTEFSAWVQEHARATASEITTENKAKFFLSQLLFNSILITAQVHAGGFSSMDLALDSFITPWAAKAIGVTIGKEKVTQFETDARSEHRRSQARIFDEALRAFMDFLDRITAGMGDLQRTLQEIVTQSAPRDEIVAYFRRQAGLESKV